MKTYIALLIMIGTVYLIRLVPFILIRDNIKNRFFKSFLYYVPYVTLAVMTFPAIIFATGSIISGIAALVVALLVAVFKGDLFTVAISACATVFVVELFLM